MRDLARVRVEIEELSARSHVPIDAGIFDLVVALRYRGFRTTGSCHGHFEAKQRMYPWVILVATTVQFPVISHTPEQKLVLEPVYVRWAQERVELQGLLDSFNSLRSLSPPDERLVFAGEHISRASKYSGMLVPTGANHLDTLPRELVHLSQATAILARYRKVMAEFAEYLVYRRT